MNPDKLFDYLEGKLPAGERAELEARLISNVQLQRELAVARRIHAGMRGDSREVLLPETDVTERGRKMALRVGSAFIVLMAVNVGVGLWMIARHEGRNPNRALLEAQTRDQILKSIEHAAATALTPAPSLGVGEITIQAAPGRLDAAAKGLPDEHRIGVMVDLPSNRETEFRAALAAISGGTPPAPSPNETVSQSSAKKSFIVQIVESAASTQK